MLQIIDELEVDLIEALIQTDEKQCFGDEAAGDVGVVQQVVAHGVVLLKAYDGA